MQIQPTEIAKAAAGKAAAAYIESGMTVGLGTGSTVSYFITELGKRCREGLNISGVASSQKTFNLATSEGIRLADVNKITHLDVTVDGADEIDNERQMIKGGGGALLREKIVASISNEMIVIVDSKKMVKHLGKARLPIEITPFAFRAVIAQIEEKGFKGSLRTGPHEQAYRTDNQNYIFDVQLDFPCLNPAEIDAKLRSIPGVLETGLFLQYASKVLVGHKDGTVNVLE